MTLLLSVGLLLTTVLGGTLAYIMTQTPSLLNTFLSGIVSDDLTITKTVSHPFGDQYVLPEDLSFPFTIDLGEELAGETVETSEGTMTADEDGLLLISLGHGDSFTIHDLAIGTEVIVTEELSDVWHKGFAAENGEERVLTVPANETFVNVYTPEPALAEDLTLTGQKVLEGREWQEEDAFEFTLKYQVPGENDWIDLGKRTAKYEILEQPDPEDPETMLYVEKEDYDLFDFTEAIKGLKFEKAGTYTFVLTETEGEIPDIAYDLAERVFTIVVGDADMDGCLEIQSIEASNNAAVEDNDLSAVFTNAYGKTSVVISIEKKLDDLSGKAAELGGFVFELYKADEYETEDAVPVAEAVSTASGTASIQLIYDIEKDAGKVYEYVLKEKNGGETIDGMTYDDTIYRLSVSVEDDGDGTISAYIFDTVDGVSLEEQEEREPVILGGTSSGSQTESEAESVPESTPVPESQPAEVPETAPETESQPAETPESTPAVEPETQPEANPEAEPEVQPETSEEQPESEAVPSESESESQPEETTAESETEIASTPADQLILSLLSATAHRPIASELMLLNTVPETNQLLPTEATVESADSNVPVETPEQPAESEVPAETPEQPEQTEVTAEETVTSAQNYVAPSRAKNIYHAVFHNTYDPEDISVQFEGKKYLTGREMKEDEFRFHLYEAEDATFAIAEDAKPVNSVYNKNVTGEEYDAFTFAEIEYATIGTRYYVLKEDSSGKLGGIGYDESEYRITVTVTDEGGKLYAETKIVLDGKEETEIRFDNEYAPKAAEVVLSGEKTVNGIAPEQSDLFTFHLFAAGNDYSVYSEDKPVQSVKNQKGEFKFEALKIDAETEAYYVIIEDNSKPIEGYTYDETKYGVHIKVTDNGEGQLVHEIIYTNLITNKTAEKPIFRNKTDRIDEIEIPLTITKILAGAEKSPYGLDGFRFKLVDRDTDSEEIEATTEAGYARYYLDFDRNDIDNTYSYRLSEINDEWEGVTYSKESYDIKIKILETEKGDLTAEIYIDGKLQEGAAIDVSFENIYGDGNDPVIIEPSAPDEEEETPPPTGDTNNWLKPLLTALVSAVILVLLWIGGKRKKK